MDTRILAAALALAVGDAGAQIVTNGSFEQWLVAPGGTVVVYGALSGEPSHGEPREPIFRDVSVRGFWLVRWFQQASAAEVAGVYGRLIPLVVDGTLHTPVEATYPLREVRAAVAHAARGGAGGRCCSSGSPSRRARAWWTDWPPRGRETADDIRNDGSVPCAGSSSRPRSRSVVSVVIRRFPAAPRLAVRGSIPRRTGARASERPPARVSGDAGASDAARPRPTHPPPHLREPA